MLAVRVDPVAFACEIGRDGQVREGFAHLLDGADHGLPLKSELCSSGKTRAGCVASCQVTEVPVQLTDSRLLDCAISKRPHCDWHSWARSARKLVLQPCLIGGLSNCRNPRREDASQREYAEKIDLSDHHSNRPNALRRRTVPLYHATATRAARGLLRLIN